MSGDSSDFMPQLAATIALGVSNGIMAGWRRCVAGPHHEMFDHREGYHYQRGQVEELAKALVILRGYGLVLHGVSAPGHRPVTGTYERGEPMISEAQVVTRLGISKSISGRWGTKGIGPGRRRSHPKHPWQFIQREVEQVRAALLVLGSYGIGLPGVEPLTLTDAFLVGTE